MPGIVRKKPSEVPDKNQAPWVPQTCHPLIHSRWNCGHWRKVHSHPLCSPGPQGWPSLDCSFNSDCWDKDRSRVYVACVFKPKEASLSKRSYHRYNLHTNVLETLVVLVVSNISESVGDVLIECQGRDQNPEASAERINTWPVSRRRMPKQTSASHILLYSLAFFIRLVLRRLCFWRFAFLLEVDRLGRGSVAVIPNDPFTNKENWNSYIRHVRHHRFHTTRPNKDATSERSITNNSIHQLGPHLLVQCTVSRALCETAYAMSKVIHQETVTYQSLESRLFCGKFMHIQANIPFRSFSIPYCTRL